MTDRHEEKKTLNEDVIIDAHADRTETELYRKSREKCLDNPPVFIIRQHPHRCWCCGRTAEEVGSPLQTHHFIIERCFAEEDINWDLVREMVPSFDWTAFDPKDPYSFVDDMSAQGLILCIECHIEKDKGIHMLEFALLLMRKLLRAGARFSGGEIIKHHASSGG